MSSQRLQNKNEVIKEEFEQDLSNKESYSNQISKKGPNQLGRPKGKKGRPKGCTKNVCKKKDDDEEDWEENAKPKERPVNLHFKEESILEGYIRIIDFLKKIEFDATCTQNKMNPYNALTANCYWYAISAEYFSYNFFGRRNTRDIGYEIIDKINRLPLQLPTRIFKTVGSKNLLPFETEELRRSGIELAEKINNLIPNSSFGKNQTIQKKMSLTTVAEDDLFLSTIRTMVYNFISKKIENSQKWQNIVLQSQRQGVKFPDKKFERHPLVKFQKAKRKVELQLLDLNQMQTKKKTVSKDKKKEISEQEKKENQIFDENEEEIEAKEVDNLQEEVGEQVVLQNGIEGEILMENPQIKSKENEQGCGVGELQGESPEKLEIQECKQQQEKFQLIKSYDEQDLILDSIMHLPLDKVIAILQNSLTPTQLPPMEEPFMPIPQQDPLEFVYQLHPEELQYLEYMKQTRKNTFQIKAIEQQNNEEVEKEEQFEDAKCQICTDGDYTDDNLIVFCSMCNISLHQRCVGLAKVPAESWVCDVCLAFGPGGINVPCPLCNVKGGAMKRTSIHIDTTLFRETNPSYYQYCKKCPYNKLKEEYIQPKLEMNQEEKEQPYYDYFAKQTYPSEQPICHYVWIHYVCAIWVPECYFEEKNGVISIKGVQNIQRRRFRYECFVCKKTRSGSSVKCQDVDCNKFYHPECARKKKVYMEQLNLEKLKYLIFCQQHEPLKITRQIQYKKKKIREEIIKFARMVEKYIETYKIAYFPFKLLKTAINNRFIETVQRNQKEEEAIEKIKQQSKISDQDFLKDLMLNLAKAKMMAVHLEKVEDGFKIVDVDQPSKREIRKCLNRYDDFWSSIKNGDTNEENFKRYERIMVENNKLREKLENFLNGNMSLKGKQYEKKEKKVGRKRGKHAVNHLETLMEEEGGNFCFCRKPYEGETDMIQCEICQDWYHYKCLGFLGTEEDVHNIEFKCMKCMKFEEDEIEQKRRLDKYAFLFLADSPLYHYRPATPQMLSQDEEQERNVKDKVQMNDKSLEKTYQKVYDRNEMIDEGEEQRLKKMRENDAVNIPSVEQKLDEKLKPIEEE